MKLGQLFDAGVPPDAAAVEITGLTADSRQVKPGYLFAALKGVAAHGRDFVAKAEAQGAAAILSAGDLASAPRAAHVVADNPRRAFALAASRFYPRRPKTIVAVTGTNGKSSTVDFLRQIWTAGGERAASLGTLGAIGPSGVIDLGHTTPDPAAVHATLQTLADDGVTHLAMEASSHGLEQHRVDGLTFDAAAFTNLTQDHLDYHADMAAYRDAKMKLWALVKAGGAAIINADAAESMAFETGAKKRGLDIILCGWRAPREHALKIVEISPRPNAQLMTLRWNGVETDVELPLIGEFQALNAVCAAALALSLDEAPEKVFAGMTQLKPVKGRMEHVGASKSGGHVFVDYAHTPDGLDVLLRAARPHAPGRIIAVFGCGGDRDTDKRPKMGAIAARQADVQIVTDDNPRSEDAASIRRAILAAAPNGVEVGDRAEAIRKAIAMMQPGDAVLIAGKGHETGQIIKGVTHPFSDQDVARAALEI
ncbi:UDP-N-acetylmuramoyl-L-alanyl-D-glutamate--2,6-diaminopimelate ligase [Terricaulis sp.]|uniref:UDP-N-acetylmuramoyl-L-alanyl-D-glutamate--2, 6-diaminopimelate ligase n=1 Tax=Terricaulis sp. TaxID=2768686 RepID=UPI003782FD37